MSPSLYNRWYKSIIPRLESTEMYSGWQRAAWVVFFVVVAGLLEAGELFRLVLV